MFTQKKPLESKNDSIYLYHLIDSEETYKAILAKGLYSTLD